MANIYQAFTAMGQGLVEVLQHISSINQDSSTLRGGQRKEDSYYLYFSFKVRELTQRHHIQKRVKKGFQPRSVAPDTALNH